MGLNFRCKKIVNHGLLLQIQKVVLKCTKYALIRTVDHKQIQFKFMDGWKQNKKKRLSTALPLWNKCLCNFVENIQMKNTTNNGIQAMVIARQVLK